MPGTPINRNDGDSDKAEVDKSRNGQDRPDEYQQENQPAVRELTQTDRLNKRLLESVLERMSNSDAYDKFLDKQPEENDLDEEDQHINDMLEDLDERDDYMSLSEHEAQDSDENEGKTNDENEQKDDDEEVGRKVVPKGTAKRIIRNPQPKLNAQRLMGPKGVHTIENYFEGFKFHGKGHEKKDLDRIMKRLEHWAHRLYPKYQFDDFLEKAEAVGSKKALTTFLKKYRRDMDFGDGGGVTNDDNDDNVERGNSPEPMDEFDMLIAEQIEKSKEATNARAQAVQKHNDKIFNNLLNLSSQPSSQIISSSQAALPEKVNNQENLLPTPSSSNDITKTNVEESEEEIKKRIERNRQMAIERRLARLKKEEENKRKKDSESQVNIESSQITDELLQTQSQSTNVENETEVSTAIEKNVNDMLVDDFDTQSVEDKRANDKEFANENLNSMSIDISQEFIDNTSVTESQTRQNILSTNKNNVDNPKDLINDPSQAAIVNKIHDNNKNNSKLLTDEELDKEIDNAVNQFIMQKRQLQ